MLYILKIFEFDLNNLTGEVYISQYCDHDCLLISIIYELPIYVRLPSAYR